MNNPQKCDQTLEYAISRSKEDRRFSTAYFLSSNILKALSWICQIVVLCGLGVLLYLGETEKNNLNIILISFSCIGVVSSVLLPVLSLERKARILSHTANELEFKVALYKDNRLTEDELQSALSNVIDKREEQHN